MRYGSEKNRNYVGKYNSTRKKREMALIGELKTFHPKTTLHLPTLPQL